MFAGLDIAHWIMFVLGLLFGALLASSGFRTTFFVKLRYFMTGIGKSADKKNRQAAGLPPREKAEGKPEKKAKAKGKGPSYTINVNLPEGNEDDDDD